MPKIPQTVRLALWILYLNLIFSTVVLVLNLKLFLAPSPEQRVKLDELSSGQLTAAFVSMVLPIAASALTLWFIRRKKRMPALIASLAVLYFSSGTVIQLLLGIVLVIVLLLRSARDYFAGVPETAKPGQAAPSVQEADETGEGEPHTASGETPAAAPAARRTRTEPIVDIRPAGPEDAEIIHRLMIAAFEEFRAAVPPSSALDETAESVRADLEGGQGAAVLYEDEEPAAMVRYEVSGNRIDFFRLSVLPARRRRGYAKRLVKWIEQLGVAKGLELSRCKVRQAAQNNVALYQDMGYEIVDRELIVRPSGTGTALIMEKKLLA